MRDMLCKAKRKDNSKWVEGYYAPIHAGSLNALREPIKEEKRVIISYMKNNGMIFDEVYPETICRETGMTDKNGKKIWENDILMCHSNKNDLCKVVHGEFYVIDVETLEKVEKVVGWHYEVLETDALSKVEPFCIPMPLTDEYIDRCEMEVIGNMWDNPELLEVK